MHFRKSSSLLRLVGICAVLLWASVAAWSQTNQNALLNGSYAFMLSGYDAQNKAVGIAGSIVANGSGNISSGVVDINPVAGSPSLNVSITGSYAIGSDNRGTLTIITPLGSLHYAIAMAFSNSGAPGQGAIIETDGVYNVTGFLKEQDTSAFSLTSMTGGYAFGVHGKTRIGFQENYLTAAGSFTASAGTMTNGLADSGSNGSPIVTNGPMSGTFSLGPNGPNGRAVVSMNGVMQSPQQLHLVLYVISSNNWLLFGTDPGILWVGSARRQSGAPFTLGSLNGVTVLAKSAPTGGGSSNVTVGVITGDGAGNATYSVDENDGGSVGTGSGAGTFALTSGANGRWTFIAPGVSLIGYMIAPNRFFMLEYDAFAQEGGVPQSAGPFNNASLSGTFILGTQPLGANVVAPPGPPTVNAFLRSGVITLDGSSLLSGSADTAELTLQNGTLSSALHTSPLSGTYSVAANGRFTASGSHSLIGYIVSPTQVVVIDATPGHINPTLHVLVAVGSAPPGTPTVAPATLDFSLEQVGVPSAAQTVTLTNSTNVTLNVASVQISGTNGGDFSQTNNCVSLAANASCTVTVRFAPTATGVRNGVLTITDDGAGSPRTVSLNGTGIQITVSPTTLTFASQSIGTTSAPQTVVVTNNTTVGISLGIANPSLNFVQTNNCGVLLAVNASCTITISFAPTVAGALTDSVSITDSVLTSPGNLHSVSLSGTATTPAGNPVPVVFSLNPAGVVAGSSSFALVVTGSGFMQGMTFYWNGSPRSSAVSNSTTLVASIGAADVAAAGTANITVATPTPGGGISNSAPFVIARLSTDEAATAPAIVETPSTTTGDTTGAATSTGNPTPPCGSHSTAKGVWFTYIAPAAGTLTIDTSGSSYQTLVSVWRGFPAFTSVGCMEATVSAAAQRDVYSTYAQPQLQVNALAGQQLYILVTATNHDGGFLQSAVSFLSTGAMPVANYHGLLPHVVAGGGYVTKLTLVNLESSLVSGFGNNVAVNFVDNNGSVVSTRTRFLGPAETWRIATPESARNGACCVTQWASISAQARVAANLFFEISDQSPQNNIINTVGFNDNASAQTFTIPVEFELAPPSVGRTVGLALSNPWFTPVTVTLKLRNTDGTQRGSDDVVQLPALGHTQRALNFDFQSVLPSGNFVGTITGTCPAGVSVVALGDDFGPFFATPPMTGGTRLVIPHIVTGNNGGAGYVTKLLLVNQAPAANTVTLAYFDQQGNPANPFSLPTSLSIPANGAVRITTPEAQRFSNTVTVEWALITATLPLGANLFFEIEDSTAQHNVINTIGFNNAPELTFFTVPVELEPGTPATPVGRTVGLAAVNANSSAATVQLTLLNQDGTTRATANRTINSMSQLLVSLQSMPEFQSLLPNGNFLGALVVHSSVPVSAIALEDDYGPFSAMPVVNVRP